MGFFSKLLLILTFVFPLSAQSQEFSPDDYETAATTYNNWLIRGLHHESLQSATPLGRYRRRIRGSFPILPLKFANEFGYSMQTLPITKDMQFAQQVFGAGNNEDLKIHRLHFSQAFNLRTDFALSGLINPDIKLYGLGVDLKYNFLQLGNILYSSARVSYSQNKRDDQFETKTYGVDLIQSLNLFIVDFYAGFRYLEGSAQFTPDPLEFEFEKRKYRSNGQYEKFYGMVFAVSDNFKISAQYNQIDEEKSLFIKIAFGVKTMVKFIPSRYQDALD